MARCRRLAPDGVVNSGKFVRAWSCPLGGKNQDSGKEEVVEKDPTHCKRLNPNEFLNGDVGFTLVNLNFGKQILVSSLWFASLLISLAIILCFRFDLLGGVVFVCVGTRNILDIIYKDTTQSYICARVKEGRNSDFGQVLHRTGLTGLHNRYDRLAFVFRG